MDLETLLGVEIVDEEQQQKKFLREKILHSITSTHNNDNEGLLDFPLVPEVPALSSQSIHDLACELSEKVKACSSDGDSDETVAKAHIQLNFLRFLNSNGMKCNVKRNRGSEANNKKLLQHDNGASKDVAGRKKNAKVVKPAKSGLSNTVVFKRTVPRKGGVQIHDNKGFDLAVDKIMREALLDATSNDVPIRENSHTQVFIKSSEHSKPRTSDAQNNINTLHSKRGCTRILEESNNASSNEVVRLEAKERQVECPVCLQVFKISESSSEAFMDTHVERCLSRSERSRRKRRSGAENMDVSDDGFSEHSKHRKNNKSRIIVDADSDTDDSFVVNSSTDDEELELDASYQWVEGNVSGNFASDDAIDRKSVGGRVKSEDVKVYDDWEESQFSNRLRVFLEDIRNEALGFIDLSNGSDNEMSLESTCLERKKMNHQYQDLDQSMLSSTRNIRNIQDGIVETDFHTLVDRRSWESMYPHQKDGVEWLWKHYQAEVSGGILGDEMGLGKSAQLCVHYSSIARYENSLHRKTRRESTRFLYPLMLLVCPATVLQHWLDEFHNWAPRLRVVLLHSISSSFSEIQELGDDGVYRALKRVATARQSSHDNIDENCGLVCVVTYEGLRRLAPNVLERVRWSAVCLDEGQKIRNPEAEITEVCKRLPCTHRLILTGTPIQNSLKELWSLFDFVFPGRLGTLFSFETEFSTPIRIGGYSNANRLQAEIAVRTATTLQEIIRPYLLRRRKDDVQASLRLPTKTEQVLFCVLSPTQRSMYEEIIQSPEVERCLKRNSPAFGPIMSLRKLCNHPCLAKESKTKSRGSRLQRANDPDADSECDDAVDWTSSGKLLVLGKVLPLWKQEGHKVLIFCQMHDMLDLVEVMLREQGFMYLRLDGHTPVQKRQGIIRDFNSIPDIFVLLLTSRTGGVGISLTAANRVILVDPDFNPQTDIQARERAWRIGQKREVTIYRLITKGTIEEKIYQRQIFKVLLSNRILDNPSQKRFFSKSDLRELFELDGAEVNAHRNNAQVANGGSDLPEAAEVDLHSENSIKESSSVEQRESNSSLVTVSDRRTSGGSKGNRDKRLLEALFNGEALTAVYDHDYFESGKKPNRHKTLDEKRINELAKKAVDNAIHQLELSSKNTSSSGIGSRTGPDSRPQKGVTGQSRALSGASMLSTMRAIKGRTQSSRSQGDRDNDPTTILRRLKELFRQRSLWSTTEILSHFGDLKDDFAPVFREMLRRIAVLKNGKWRLADEER